MAETRANRIKQKTIYTVYIHNILAKLLSEALQDEHKPVLLLHTFKIFSAVSEECYVSVAKIRDVVVGVASVTLGSVVSDPQVVKSWQENQQAYDDDRNGAVGMLRTELHNICL